MIASGRYAAYGVETKIGRVLVLAVLLSGCGVGQQTQTATMQPAVNGAMATVNDIALHNIRICVLQRGAAAQPGETVNLALVVTNQSPDTADALVRVTSDIGGVAVVGDATVPAGGTLIVDSPDRLVHARPLAAVKSLKTATATVLLTRPVSNGLVYRFTFQFAHAGETTVGVPVSTE